MKRRTNLKLIRKKEEDKKKEKDYTVREKENKDFKLRRKKEKKMKQGEIELEIRSRFFVEFSERIKISLQFYRVPKDKGLVWYGKYKRLLH